MKALTCTERKRMKANHQPVGRWIRVDKRLAVYLRDGFRCLCCGRDLRDADPRDVTLDHAKARCDGGSNHESNIYTACVSCNSRRQDKPLYDFVGPERMRLIRRNLKRSLTKYRLLAKAILAGDLDHDTALVN